VQADPTSNQRNVEEWNKRFGSKDGAWFFGKEPSDMARWVWHFWEATGKAPGRLIDLGAGEGRDAVYFAHKGFEVTAVEASDSGIEKVSILAAEREVSLRSIKGDIRDADLAGYDVVYSNNCIQLIGSECLNYLERMKAVTPVGGLCAVSAFSNERNRLCEQEDFYCFSRGEMASYFEGWKLLWADDMTLWRTPSQDYRSFTAIIAEKLSS
jgi:tellurite methyltransferase